MQYFYPPVPIVPIDPREYQRMRYRDNLKKDSFGIGMLLIIIEIVSFFLSLIIVAMTLNYSNSFVLTFLQDGFISIFLFFIPALIFVLVKGLSVGDIFPFRHDVPHLTAPLVLFGLAISLASNLVSSLMSSFFDLFGVSTELDMGLHAETPFEICLYFLTVAIIPALVEEFTFRGVLVGVLEKYSKGLAIISSAILFALIHGNFQQIFFVFPVGLVLGYVRVVSGSMLPGMIIHCLNNGISVFFSILTDNEILSESYINLIDCVLMVVIAILGIVSAVILFGKSREYPQLFRFSDANKVISFREKMAIFWKRPAVIIFSAIMVVQSILFLFIT